MRTAFFIVFSILSLQGFNQAKSFVVYFDNDSHVSSSSSQRDFTIFLQQVNKDLLKKITVHGHADKNASDGYNVQLSKRRALHIEEELKQIFPAVPTTIFYSGEVQPLTNDEGSFHLNRRVEIVFEYKESSLVEMELQPYSSVVEEQEFQINLEDTSRIAGKEGSGITIFPFSIQDKEGKLMKGKAELKLREYYKPSDILLAGLNSSSAEGLLQTGGMIRFIIIQNGDTASSTTRKKITLAMPVNHPELNNMNVYNMPPASTPLWNNTGISFLKVNSYWAWPSTRELFELQSYWDFKFQSWQNGKKYSDSYKNYKGLFTSYRYYSFPKTVDLLLEKIDSASVLAKVKMKFHRKTIRHLGLRSLDTSFIIPFVQQQYYAGVNEMNFINCDRFLNRTSLTEITVTTPGFRGVHVLAWFKNLHAFMNVPSSGGGHLLSKIPPGEKVCLVAIGKKDEDFYYAQADYTTEAGGNAMLQLQKTTETEIKEKLKLLK